MRLHFCTALLSAASCRRCCPSLLTADQRIALWVVANYNREHPSGRVTQLPYLRSKLPGKGLASGWREKVVRLESAHCKASNGNYGSCNSLPTAFTAESLSHPESVICSTRHIWNLESHRHAGTWLSLELLPTYLIRPGPEHPLSLCMKSGSVQFQYGHGHLDKRCM